MWQRMFSKSDIMQYYASSLSTCIADENSRRADTGYFVQKIRIVQRKIENSNILKARAAVAKKLPTAVQAKVFHHYATWPATSSSSLSPMSTFKRLWVRYSTRVFYVHIWNNVTGTQLIISIKALLTV